MSRGFTLLEVVVALLLLEIAVMSAAGTLTVASRTLTQAEHLERAVIEAEGVLDSLAGTAGAVSGSRAFVGGELMWSVDVTGQVALRVSGADGRRWLEVVSAVALP
jgi:Tfp pilus assembly protein PilV